MLNRSIIFDTCPNRKCQYRFISSPDIRVFECPVCTGAYCLLCNNILHEGMTCAVAETLYGEYDVMKSEILGDNAARVFEEMWV